MPRAERLRVNAEDHEDVAVEVDLAGDEENHVDVAVDVDVEVAVGDEVVDAVAVR